MAAISSGSPGRPSGVRDSTRAIAAGSLTTLVSMSVRIEPGPMAFTRMPWAASLIEAAAVIWKDRDHVNLTGHHLHNYRVGHGKVGEWKTTLTNHHLEMMREKGIEPIFKEFGYPFEYLDESQYTEFQKTIDGYIRRGEICDPTKDRDLFTFAFNKSNINSEKFPFRRYPWKAHTQLERSCFTELELEQEIWETAESVAGKVNAVLDEVAACDFYQRHTAEAALNRIERCRGTFDPASNAAFDQSLKYARELTRQYFLPVPVGAKVA